MTSPASVGVAERRMRKVPRWNFPAFARTLSVDGGLRGDGLCPRPDTAVYIGGEVGVTLLKRGERLRLFLLLRLVTQCFGVCIVERAAVDHALHMMRRVLSDGAGFF